MVKLTRRSALLSTAMFGIGGCSSRKDQSPSAAAAIARRPVSPDEEYVWISANSNLPLFVAHDHQALYQVGRELGVKVTIAGPNTIDIPGLVATVEQTAARRPAGTAPGI